MIPTDSKYKARWDLLVMFLVIYLAIELPFEIGFNITVSPVLNYFIIAFFIIDIIASLRTTYYNDDKDEIGKKVSK
jgi:hypothetical protein